MLVNEAFDKAGISWQGWQPGGLGPLDSREEIKEISNQQTHFAQSCWGFFLNQKWVVISNIFYFHPYLGKIFQFD